MFSSMTISQLRTFCGARIVEEVVILCLTIDK